MIKIWGLKNCDTCRKARKWLEDVGVPHCFYDVRQDGLDVGHIEKWLQEVGIDGLLNRRSTTWRNLPQEIKENISEENVSALLAEHPALIKRPVFEHKSHIYVGLTDEVKCQLI